MSKRNITWVSGRENSVDDLEVVPVVANITDIAFVYAGIKHFMLDTSVSPSEHPPSNMLYVCTYAALG